MRGCIEVRLIARRKSLEGCGAVGLVRRQLKIKQKPLISSNKTPTRDAEGRQGRREDSRARPKKDKTENRLRRRKKDKMCKS